MNHDFTTDSTETEQENAALPTRRPKRRARRTVAPFAKSIPLEDEKAPKNTELNEATLPAETDFEASLDANDASESIESATTEEVSLSDESTVADEADDETEPNHEDSEENAETNEAESTEENCEEAVDTTEEEEKLSPIAETFDWIKSFLFSLTVVIFIFTLVFRGVTVNGGSMLPTLENGEYLIISDLLYTPKNGDIVVVQSPHYKNATEPLIKRVIATGGQTVKINFSNWEVWVDGELLHEDYILRDGATSMNCEDLKPDENGEVEFKVDEGCVFVMGDHRNDSLDSRSNSVGQIDERYIMGRVVIRLSPVERFGKVA